MKEESSKPPTPPRHGYISELALMCNCSRKTVSRALFKGQQGKKADIVRLKYRELYGIFITT
jgi:hypothetical protein